MSLGLWLNKCYFDAKMFFRGLIYDEDGDVNIVSIVVLIGIAIVLAIVFRKNILTLLNTLFGTITTNGTDAIKKEN